MTTKASPNPRRRVPAHPAFCVVSFHAHPDDEALLTGGTLARAAAEGHRVVVVVATLGEAGLASGDAGDLGARRLAELRLAAAALGVARVVWLGYADSGLGAETRSPGAFADADAGLAADRLVAALQEERADVLTVYDAVGGYGHPDHVQVHQVGRLAGERAGTPVVLEATVDRQALLRVARAATLVPGLPPAFRPAALRRAYTSPEALTHCVDVGSQITRKRAAFAAHGSQQTGGATRRSIAVYLALPMPLFRVLFGREWFIEVGSPGGRPLCDDIFASLRERGA